MEVTGCTRGGSQCTENQGPSGGEGTESESIRKWPLTGNIFSTKMKSKELKMQVKLTYLKSARKTPASNLKNKLLQEFVLIKFAF